MSHHLPYATTRCVTPPVDPEITDEDIGRWLDDERNLRFRLPKGELDMLPDLVSPRGDVIMYPDELLAVARRILRNRSTKGFTDRVVEAMREEAT